MAVGQDKPVRRHDHAGACAAARLACRAAVSAMDGEANDGWADAVDYVDNRLRIGIKERLIVGRDGRKFWRGCGPASPERVGQRDYCHELSVS
jgi:hypothetical protein